MKFKAAIFFIAIGNGILGGLTLDCLVILIRAFFLWDWWPDTNVDYFTRTSESEIFLVFLRAIFAVGFVTGCTMSGESEEGK